MHLTSIQIGLPQGAPSTAILKQSVTGPLLLDTLGFIGDRSANGRIHGGPSRAVCVFPLSHYEGFATLLGLESLPPGAFGENLTVKGLDESSVCLGDIWGVGGARLQITSPRAPCARLDKRWGGAPLRETIVRTGQCGFMMRVVSPGFVQADTAIELLERPTSEVTVRDAHHQFYDAKGGPAFDRALEALDFVAPDWLVDLRKRRVGARVGDLPRPV